MLHDGVTRNQVTRKKNSRSPLDSGLRVTYHVLSDGRTALERETTMKTITTLAWVVLASLISPVLGWMAIDAIGDDEDDRLPA